MLRGVRGGYVLELPEGERGERKGEPCKRVTSSFNDDNEMADEECTTV